MRRRCRAGLSALARVQNARDFFRRNARAQQRAGHNADHIVQKAVRRHRHRDKLALAPDAEAEHAPHRVGDFRAGRHARAEVVPADEGLRGVVERRSVERVRPEQRAAVFKRVAQAAVADAVNVFLSRRAVPRVERPVCLAGGAHRDVRRQRAVERERQRVGRDDEGDVHMADEAAGMHARVGPRAAGDRHRRAVNLRGGLADDGLHGQPVFLRLPAAVARAVEGERQRHPRHDSDTPLSSTTAAVQASITNRNAKSENLAFGTFIRVRFAPPL